ncbi:MAG: ATP-binding protein [Actinomycetes bacterium]
MFEQGAAMRPLVAALQALAGATSRREVVDVVLRGALSLTGAESVEVVLDGSIRAGQTREVRGTREVPEAWCRRGRERVLDAGTTCRAARDRLATEVLGLDAAAQDPREVPSDWLGVPVRDARGRATIGVVQVFWPTNGLFTSSAATGLEALVAALPLALARPEDGADAGAGLRGRWRVDREAGVVHLDALAAAASRLVADAGPVRDEEVAARLDPDELPRLRGLLAAGRRGRPFAVTCRVHGIDGVPRWIRVEGARAPEGWLEGTLEDVTAQVRARTELAEAQRLHGLGHLAAGVVHDLNNWLAVILGNGELLAEEHQSEEAAAVLAAAEKAGDLTARLMRFAADREVTPGALDANDVLVDLHPLLRSACSAGLTLELDLTVEPLPVWIDGTHLTQVVVNLVLNARDAVGSRGTVHVRTERLPGPDGETLVAITVEDDGVGMDAATLARCTDPFFTSKAAGSGTGLGLSTSVALVEAAGGRVELTSQPGAGTRVTVLLPERLEEPVEDGDPVAADLVVLAEDEPVLLDILTRVLERSGIRVLPVADVAGATAALRRHGPAVAAIVCDLVLSDGTASDVLRVADRHAPAAGRLIVSGHGGLDEVGAELGAQVLRKPFRGQELSTVVAGLLGERAASVDAASVAVPRRVRPHA